MARLDGAERTAFTAAARRPASAPVAQVSHLPHPSHLTVSMSRSEPCPTLSTAAALRRTSAPVAERGTSHAISC
jgi:hypothetical protein